MAGDPRWLFDGVGAAWLAWEENGGLTVAPWMAEPLADGRRHWEKVHLGWDATVDHHGGLWVTWSQGEPSDAMVYVQCYADGEWGPRLQVSTMGANVGPLISPDEYGNVWIFWERRTESADIVMCRMGPRSGQETRVARNAAHLRSVGTREGTLYVTYGADSVYAVTGTEHQGFGEPVPLP